MKEAKTYLNERRVTVKVEEFVLFLRKHRQFDFLVISGHQAQQIMEILERRIPTKSMLGYCV